MARAWWFNWRVGWPERRRLLYGERLPFHSWTRRLPAWLDWARRPWDTVVSGLLLRPVRLEPAADAILLELRKPDAPGARVHRSAARARVQP